jgi:chemotaxis protein methyltransferase CheR
MKVGVTKVVNISMKEYDYLTQYIKANYGINLKEEKQQMVAGRLQKVLQEHGFTSFTEYNNYIMKDKTGKAAAILINHITTNHTFFMREAEHFNYFRETVLPYLHNTVKDKDLRIWCAGCSTGEEPYTLAMLIDEYLGQEKKFWDSKILATDLSSRVLEKASKGEYNNDEMANLPKPWKINYVKPINKEKSIIVNKIKNEVIFRKFNLMEPKFPFKRKLHAIFCRNVMIYFDTATRNELINKFYDSLEYGGYLFIGHSETINRDETKFKYIKPAVYRKE